MNLIALADLMPDADDLWHIAYESTCGDAAMRSVGRHGGWNPDRKDMEGVTKRVVYRHASTRDMALFASWAARLAHDPWHFPSSRRTWVEKVKGQPSKGWRPIDDPAETKRLVLLHVRKHLESKLESRMTTGQYGGRPRWAIRPSCKRDGATNQDHVADAIRQEIWTGNEHVVLLDLKDAFGQVPHRALINALKDMGLDATAAKWIRRQVQIDAWDGTRLVRTRCVGIEQGNQLSACLMNLVLAPIFREVEAVLPVRVVSYVDDIYIMAPDNSTARQAFAAFSDAAKARGFRNVRPLDGRSPKASRIIDASIEPVPVLKTFMVSKMGVALHPDKIADLQTKGLHLHGMTINGLRTVTACQSLNKYANRQLHQGLLRLPTKQAHKNGPKGLVHLVAARGTTTVELGDENLRELHEGSAQGFHQGSHNDQRCNLRDDLGHVDHGACTGYCGDGQGDVEHGVHVYPTNYGDVPTDGDSHLQDGNRADAGPSHHNQASGIPENRNSTDAEGRNKPSDSRQVGAATPPACLSVSLPEVLAAIRQRKPIKVGDNYKGLVADLRGLDAALSGGVVSDHALVAVVNGMVKAVRCRGVATVVYDPMSVVGVCDAVLGGVDDATYEQISAAVLEDGAVRVEIRHRRRKPDAAPRNASELPQADLIVLRATCTNRASGRYKVHLADRLGHRDVTVMVPGPSEVAGVLTAVAQIVSRLVPATVAIRLDGSLHAARVLVGDVRPRLVPFGDAVRALASGRTWKILDQSWAVARVTAA